MLWLPNSCTCKLTVVAPSSSQFGYQHDKAASHVFPQNVSSTHNWKTGFMRKQTRGMMMASDILGGDRLQLKGARVIVARTLEVVHVSELGLSHILLV